MRIVLDHLRNQSTHAWARDISRSKQHRKLGIDIIWGETTGRKTALDVKGDQYPEENFFFETWSVAEERIPGCLLTSQAEFWYYYFLQTRGLWILPIEPCRVWFLDAIKAGSLPYPESDVDNDDPIKGTYTTKGYAVPISLVRAALHHATPQPARIQL